MTTLRSQIIRLAYENPSLRTALLPLVEKEASHGMTVGQLMRGLQSLDPNLEVLVGKERSHGLRIQAVGESGPDFWAPGVEGPVALVTLK